MPPYSLYSVHRSDGYPQIYADLPPSYRQGKTIPLVLVLSPLIHESQQFGSSEMLILIDKQLAGGLRERESFREVEVRRADLNEGDLVSKQEKK